MNVPKFWLKSKTILFHLAVSAVGVWSILESYLPNLKTALDPKQYGLVLVIVGIVGVALRVVTNTAIALKKGGQ